MINIKKLFYVFLIAILVVGLSGLSVYLIDMIDQDSPFVTTTTTSTSIPGSTSTTISSDSSVITTTSNLISIDSEILIKMSLSNVMITTIYEHCYTEDNCIILGSEQGSGTIIDHHDGGCMPPIGYAPPVCIDPWFDILTNFHVISNPEIEANSVYYTVRNAQGMLFSAVYSKGSSEFDLAILQSTGELTNSDIVDLNLEPQSIMIGSMVYAVGSPNQTQSVLSQGTFTSLYALNSYSYDVLQHTATLSEGSSGGALYNEFGEFLGINTFMNELGYYAIPRSVILLFLDS